MSDITSNPASVLGCALDQVEPNPTDAVSARAVLWEHDAPNADAKHFEITLPGFDGETDETDHLILWVSADSREAVECGFQR